MTASNPHQCIAEGKKLQLTDTQSRTGQQARLTLPDGRIFDLDIMKPTLGDAVVCDVRTLYNSGKVLFYDPGLNSVASCASAVTHTDGDRGICLYRGYSVPELLEKHDYLTVAYLLLYGQLPAKSERMEFEDRIKSEMLIHTRLKEFITTFVPGAHPMSILVSRPPPAFPLPSTRPSPSTAGHPCRPRTYETADRAATSQSAPPRPAPPQPAPRPPS